MTAISTGESHACALIGGAIKCWGENLYGQLGYGNTNNIGDEPFEMGDYLPFVSLGGNYSALQVSCGGDHTCAVLDNWQVKCWGLNGEGQLGYGDTAERGNLPGEMGDNLPFVDVGTGLNVTQIYASLYFTCALLGNQRVKCWGSNEFGQLGIGDVESSGYEPSQMGDNLGYVLLGDAGPVVQLVLGYFHVCALFESQNIKCWGDNTFGQLGLGDTIARGETSDSMGNNLPFVSLGANVLSLSTHAVYHTCAILVGHLLKCWGRNGAGQLGQGELEQIGYGSDYMGDNLPYVDLGSNFTVLSVDCGYAHTCAILDSHEIKCWGDTNYGQTGITDISIEDDYGGGGIFIDVTGDNLPFVNLGSHLSVEAVETGDYFTCAVFNTSQIKCFGENDEGQLGLGNPNNYGVSSNQMSDALPFVQLFGPQYIPPFTPHPTLHPTLSWFDKNPNLPPLFKISDICVSFTHICVIFEAPSLLKCFGDNSEGYLGMGSVVPTADTISIGLGENLPFIDLGSAVMVQSVTSGIVFFDSWYMGIFEGYFTCVLLVPGNVKCFGANFSGLGYNQTTIGRVPGEMGDNLPDIDLGTNLLASQIDAGSGHICALLNNAQIKCWGKNLCGQLGLGNIVNQGEAREDMGDNLPFVDLGTNLSASAVITGGEFTCVILNTGMVKCWGLNIWGQLGLGNNETMGDEPGEMGDSLPTLDFGNGAAVVTISSGFFHSCVILVINFENQLKCWGQNEYGQLGLGDSLPRGASPGQMGDNLPVVDLGTNQNVQQVSCGGYNTCALLKSGFLKCWGANNYGQLGLGDDIERGGGPTDMGDNLPFVPLNYESSLSLASVDVCIEVTCVLYSNGVFMCWGENQYLSLGIGEDTSVAAVGIEPGDVSMGRYLRFALTWSGRIPSFIDQYTSLDFTYSSKGILDYLPDALGELQQLTSLDLSYNNIVGEVPESFGNLSNLLLLDLSYNDITSIPRNLSYISGLQTVYLGNNDIHCDCILLSWFGEWANGRLKDWSSTTCGYQNTYSGTPIASILVDPEAPCYEPYNVSLIWTNSTAANITWEYDWATYLPYDIVFDVQCTFIEEDLIQPSIPVPWDSTQPNLYSFVVDEGLNPYTDYFCIVYPVYEYYDTIILKTHQNPASPAEADNYLPQDRTSRRVRGPGSIPVIFQTDPSAPIGVITNLGLAARYRDELSLQWDPPSVPNCDPQSLFYEVEVQNIVNVTTPNTAITITASILPGTSYFVRVRAFNSFGSTEFSPYEEFTTEPPCPPGEVIDTSTEERICIQCPKGTYATTSTGQCQICGDLLHEPNVNQTGCVECNPGYSVDSITKFCVACPSGTYRSADLTECTPCVSPRRFTLFVGATSANDCVTGLGFYMDNNGSAIPCPTGADCTKEYGLTVETLPLLPGYWRAMNTTANILPCYHPNYCTPPTNNNNNNNNNSRRLDEFNFTITDNLYCSKGQSGVLCESCLPGLSLLKIENGCGECTPDLYQQEISVLMLLIVFVPAIYIFLICMVVFVSKSAESNSGKLSKTDAIMYWLYLLSLGVSPMMITLQTVGLIFAQYPDRFDKSITSGSASGLSVLALKLEDIIRFPCLFPGLNAQYSSMMFSLFGTLWIIMVTYIAGTAITQLIFSSETTKKDAKTWFFYAEFVILIYIYPSVCAAILRTFQCVNYGGFPNLGESTLYALQSDPTVICYEWNSRTLAADYEPWYIASAIFAVLYIPTVPAIFLGILWKNHALLIQGIDLTRSNRHLTKAQLHNLEKLDAFHSEYRPDCYWSGPVILVYRLVITSILPLILVLSNVSEGLQLVIIFLALILGCVLLEIIKPYATWAGNISAMVGLVSVCMVVYSASLYGSDISTAEDPDSSYIFGQMLISALVILLLIIGGLSLLVDGIIPAWQRWRRGVSIWDVEYEVDAPMMVLPPPKAPHPVPEISKFKKRHKLSVSFEESDAADQARLLTAKPGTPGSFATEEEKKQFPAGLENKRQAPMLIEESKYKDETEASSLLGLSKEKQIETILEGDLATLDVPEAKEKALNQISPREVEDSHVPEQKAFTLISLNREDSHVSEENVSVQMSPPSDYKEVDFDSMTMI